MQPFDAEAAGTAQDEIDSRALLRAHLELAEHAAKYKAIAVYGDQPIPVADPGKLRLNFFRFRPNEYGCDDGVPRRAAGG